LKDALRIKENIVITILIIVVICILSIRYPASSEIVKLISFILAIVGALFAILAKLKADVVFKEAKNIHKSISSFFDRFECLFDTTRTRTFTLTQIVESAENKLILFLGIPLVGFFKKPEYGISFINLLRKKINGVDKDLKIYFISLNKKIIENYFKEAKHLSEPEKNKFHDETRDLLNLLSPPLLDCDRLKKRFLTFDPYFRFVVADDRKAIFWVLRDWKGKADFEAFGFTTEDPEMIDGFIKLFDYYHDDKDICDSTSGYGDRPAC
jgi:hypothetical protein